MIRRSAIIAVIVALAAAALWRGVWLPQRCNVLAQTVLQSTEQLDRQRDPFAARRTAERNLQLLEQCMEVCRTDPQFPMSAGNNLMLLGRPEAAATMYRRALEADRRPEIYAALASAQIATGDRAGAVQSLVAAGDFAGKEYLRDFEDVGARMEAYGIVDAHEARAAAARGEKPMPSFVLNGDFSEGPGLRGASTTDTGSGTAWPSASASWNLWADEPATVTSQLVPSTRRPGAMMLRIKTTGRTSGIYQDWGGRRGIAPQSVRTTAWVFVRSGQVSVGSGRGSMSIPDAYSRTTGQWERLEGANTSCPATQTNLFTASAGADFDVDLVEVVDVPGPPCEQR